ncbi:MAG: 4-(cytidine 5'-diphospho)-2-C-methyl-D-erythritol kinase [Chloroflexota bacterium]
MTSLRLEAPAKLNLSLRVVDRRPDDYHELDGVMLLIELADRLCLVRGGSGLRVSDAAGEPATGVPAQSTQNLAWRGLLAGLQGSPHDGLGRLELEKRVPVAAGLGGGSSDAAAAWRLGRRWLGRDELPGSDELAALARIGADVPFFAASTPAARVRGIGERIDPIDAPQPQEVVLAHPPRSLSTAAVFAAYRPRDGSAEAATTMDDALRNGRNDLWPAARRLAPELDDLAALITAAGGRPRLSGSGPTLFCITDDAERAAGITRRLERAGLRVARTRSRSHPATIELIDEEDP